MLSVSCEVSLDNFVKLQSTDARDVIAGSTVRTSTSMNVVNPLYIGGVPQEIAGAVKNVLRVIFNFNY